MSRHRFQGFLPSQRTAPRPPKVTGKMTRAMQARALTLDEIGPIPPRLGPVLAQALKFADANDLPHALQKFSECATLDHGAYAMHRAVLIFGSDAAQRAYFMLKQAERPPAPEMLASYRKMAVDLSEALCEVVPTSKAFHNYARFLHDDGLDAASVPLYEKAARLNREQVETWGNLGTAYLRLGQRADAERAWGKCVAFPAENASGMMAQAYIKIRRGEWAEGWRLLNKRWDDPTFTQTYGRKDLNARATAWHGEPLKKGESVYLHGEQGLGDHVMFARYIPELVKRGVPIAAFETRVALKGWFDACWLGCPVTVRDEGAMPAFTHHAPIMSLPGILGMDTIPPPLAPALPPVENRATCGTLRVGVVWRGTRGNIMDAQRSLPDECLAQLGSVTGIEWVPLLHDPSGENYLTAHVWIGDTVAEPPKFNDVLALAELMRTCDHVLTVDTLHAHLAGSLGVPSTVLHRYHREWRWGLDTTETAWYAGQRLVTCPSPDAWGEALREAVEHIKVVAASAVTAGDSSTLEPEPVPAVTTTPVSGAEVAVETPSTPGSGPHLRVGVQVEQVQGRWGKFWVNRLDAFVGRSLIEYGEFSKGEADLFGELVQPSWHVVECGANIGAHTRQLTMLAQHVTAYEPNPDNAELLRWNAPKAEVIEAAVGRTSGLVTIDAPDPTLPGNFGGLHVGVPGPTVPMVTLGASGDFLKLDVEGMELEILHGAPELMARRPIIYAEADSAGKAEPLLAWFASKGYRVWWHPVPLFTYNNFRANHVNVFGGVVSINVLAVPTERGLPVVASEHGLLDSSTTTMMLNA